MPKVVVQILSYNGSEYLPDALESLNAQTFADFELMVLDNGSLDDSYAVLERELKKFKRPHFLTREEINIGFAGGHNKLFAMHEAPYVLCMNQDTVLDPRYIETLADFLDRNQRAGAVSGKLERLGPTGHPIIDSAGLAIKRSRAVFDIGAGTEDNGQYDGVREVFGVSGALPLYRRAAIDDVSEDRVPFDSSYFAYKEDVDLAWRLRLRGWEAYVVGSVSARHARTLKSERQKKVRGERIQLHAPERQYLSSRNQLLMLAKDERRGDFFRDFFHIIGFEIAKFFFLLFRQPETVAAYGGFMQLLPAARKKRTFVQSRRTDSIRKWINRYE